MQAQDTHARNGDEAAITMVVMHQVDADALVQDTLAAESIRRVEALAILMHARLPLAPLQGGTDTPLARLNWAEILLAGAAVMATLSGKFRRRRLGERRQGEALPHRNSAA